MARPSELPSLFRALVFTVWLAVRNYPWVALGSLTLVPFGWVSGTLTAYWLKGFVDGALAHDIWAVVVAVSALVLTVILGWVATGLGQRMLKTFQDKVQLVLERRLIDVSAGLRGVEHLERPEYLDKLDPLRRDTWIVHWSLEALAECLGAIATTSFTVAFLIVIDPLLTLLPLFSIPAILTARAGSLRDRQAQEETGEARRLQRHLTNLGTKASSGKEIRVFEMASEIRRLNRRAWEGEHRVRVRAAWVHVIWRMLSITVMAIGFTGALLLVGYRIVNGQATVGDLALALLLVQSLSFNVGLVIEMVWWLVGCLAISARFVWLHDRKEAEDQRVVDNPVPVPDRLRRGISLAGVTFAYPGTSRPILDNVSLTFPAGSVTAIVGENGAGKTTLVKLLCGMYSVDEGAVLIDDVPLDELDLAQWRQRCTGAFQDHARFELVMHDAIAIGDPTLVSREKALVSPRAKVERALVAAGAGDLAPMLDTQLGPTWPGGTELSGGQWQKVALARAFMREEPLLTVLDEPTSALDAQTEDTLFARYAEAARTGRSRGTVTLLVSHRFSTVRTADHIVVLDRGRVIEQGSHGELMRLDGHYAALYRLQARGYR